MQHNIKMHTVISFGVTVGAVKNARNNCSDTAMMI